MPAPKITATEKPTAPSDVPASLPETSLEDVSHDSFTGNRGNSGNNNVLQCDATNNQCVILQSRQGNVYIEAGALFQSECVNRIEEVTGMKHLYTAGHIVDNSGTLDGWVDGITTIVLNADLNLDVVGTHTHKVIDHVFEAQSQKVSVSGAQNIIVGGAQDIHVASRNEVVDGSSNTEVNGPKKYKFGAEMINNTLGDCKWIKASTDRNITIADKEQINCAIEISLNVGASEKVNVGAHAEQTFGLKFALNCSGEKTVPIGPSKTAAASTKDENVALIKKLATQIAKENASIINVSVKMQMMSVKMYMFK